MHRRPAAMPRLSKMLVLLAGLLGNCFAQVELDHQELDHVNQELEHHEEKEKFERQFGDASCAFDAGLGAFYLIRAGLEAFAGSESCPEEKKEECTMDVAGAISCFADMASYFALVAQTCPQVLNAKAVCTAHITELAAGVSELISQIPGIRAECKASKEKQKIEIEHTDVIERRLSQENQAIETIESKIEHENHEAVETTECVVDVGQATFLLGHAGLELTEATKACPESEEGLVCGTAISGMLASFSLVAAYIAGAVTDCGQTVKGSSVCTSVVAKIIGSLGEISAGAAGIAHSCVRSVREADHEGKVPGHAIPEPAGHSDAKPRELLAMPHGLIDRERRIFRQALNHGVWNKADLEDLVAAFPNRSLQLMPSAETRAKDFRMLLDKLQRSMSSRTASTLNRLIAFSWALIIGLFWPFSFM